MALSVRTFVRSYVHSFVHHTLICLYIPRHIAYWIDLIIVGFIHNGTPQTYKLYVTLHRILTIDGIWFPTDSDLIPSLVKLNQNKNRFCKVMHLKMPYMI